MRWLTLLLGWQISLAGQGVDGEYVRAWRLAGQGKTGEAVRLLHERIERGSAQARDVALLAQVYAEYGRLDEGNQYFRGAVLKAPGSAVAHYGLALVLMQVRRSNEGLAEAVHCVRLDPSIVGCYEVLVGRLGDRMGRATRLTRFEDILPAEPGRAEWQFALSRLQATMGNQQAAVTTGETAVRLARERGTEEPHGP
jgi:tetratricopeptide (TPR) repeat protein